jgi:arylsulfatase A-like enzyme
MLNKTKPIRSTLSVITALSFAVCAHAADENTAGTQVTRRPNILLIIGDDIGLDVSTSMYPGLIDKLSRQYGPSGRKNPDYQAIRGKPASIPHLAHLARQGMVFSSTWAEPFCSPTRASILTGLFASNSKVLSYADPLSSHYTSFVQQLKDEGGYSTAIFGKWHLAGLPGKPVGYPGMKPKQAGFDLFRGNLHAAITNYWDYDYQVQDETTPADQWRTEKPPTRSLPGIAPTTFGPVVKVADAIDWITAQEKASPRKPWFTWLAFNLSHATIRTQPSQMAVPNADTLDTSTYNEMKACGGKFGTQDTGSCSGESQMRAMTNALDTTVGKLLDVVDGGDKNTYVIYLGDNGTPMYGRPRLDFIDNMYITRKGRGKGTAYESGARVPLVIRGPGIGANKASSEYVHTADLFSTILSLAGLQPPEKVSNSDGSGTIPVDGMSLTPILKGKATHLRDPNEGYLLTQSLNLMTNSSRQVGARNATYKVICNENAQPGSCVFYNLIVDPLEEYPLDKPTSCSGYASGGWTAAEPRWHFCRLSELIRTKSFLAQAK